MSKETRDATAEGRPSYKDTLNLLQTGFGMRANAVKREPELQAFWKDQGIDGELGLNNSGPTFTLHDGPPYANGALHMGHALNKVLKDVINKFQVLKGRRVRYVPGWDCHGLPIELKVLQSMDQEQRKALTPFKLRKKAAAYARKQVDGQMKGFQRWGIWADWEKPYLTLQKEYESAQIRVFGEMVLKGHIYRGPETGALEPKLTHRISRSGTGISRRPHEPQRLRRLPSREAAGRAAGCPQGRGPGSAHRGESPGEGPSGGDLDHHTVDLAGQPGGVGE